MKCVYCPIHSEKRPVKHSPKVIDLAFARLGIDDYFCNGFFKKGEKKGVRIFSNGEPMMEFKRVKAIVDYANKKAGNNLFVEMQTNGLFNKEAAEWIGKNIDLLWISLDGPVDIQDKQRPTVNGKSSFRAIDRNIGIINKFPGIKVGIRATISRDNVKKQKELVDYAVKKRLAAVCPDPWGSAVPVSGQPDLMLFADEFFEAWKYAKKKGVAMSTEMTVNFDEETEIYCRSCLPAPQFTPDGCVSTCDMVTNGDSFLARVFPELIIGRFDKKNKKIIYFPEHIKKISSRNIYNLPECQKCPALKHCAGGCIGLAMASSMDFYGAHKKYCPVVRYLFKKMSSYVNSGFDPSVPIHP